MWERGRGDGKVERRVRRRGARTVFMWRETPWQRPEGGREVGGRNGGACERAYVKTAKWWATQQQSVSGGGQPSSRSTGQDSTQPNCVRG